MSRPGGTAPPDPWRLSDREGHTIDIFQRAEVPDDEIRACDSKGNLVPEDSADATAIALHPLKVQQLWERAGGG